MFKFLFLMLFLPGIALSQSTRILNHSYNFLVFDGEIKKLTQSHDTLYEFHCYIDKPCVPKAENHYRILSSIRKGEFIFLKLEQLDTISMTTTPYPLTRYCALALQKINAKQLGYLPLRRGLTKGQLDTLKTDTELLKNKFFFTYFSDQYLLEFNYLKKLSTKEQGLEIAKVGNSDKIKQLVERYKITNTGDMYGAGLNAEIMNQVCLELGFNPIGAGRAMNKIMRQ